MLLVTQTHRSFPHSQQQANCCVFLGQGPFHLSDSRETAPAANEIVADDDYEQQHATLSVRCRTATEPVHVCATNVYRFSWLAVPLPRRLVSQREIWVGAVHWWRRNLYGKWHKSTLSKFFNLLQQKCWTGINIKKCYTFCLSYGTSSLQISAID